MATKNTTLRKLQQQARKIAAALAQAYPDAYDAECRDDPFASLISTILSAQCTDAKVEQVLPRLWQRYPTPAALAAAKPAEVARIIRSLGLYRSKARYIVGAARKIMSDFGGAVPANMTDLVSLPGVGRKTANCVLLNAFGQPAIMCDTHCCRVTRRLGLHSWRDPTRIEMRLRALLAPAAWGEFSHRIIVHGRRICQARRPQCRACVLQRWCVTGRMERRRQS